jgi:hypothetical protein
MMIGTLHLNDTFNAEAMTSVGPGLEVSFFCVKTTVDRLDFLNDCCTERI